MGSETKNKLASAPLGTKAPAIGGGHWVKVERGWKWHNGDTFPKPGGDWDGTLVYPTPPQASETKRDSGERGLDTREQDAVAGGGADTFTRTEAAQLPSQLTATPTPTADGEADFAEVESYIRSDAKTTADRANALIALGNIRALRARPLPADVQAVSLQIAEALLADESAVTAANTSRGAFDVDAFLEAQSKVIASTLLAHLQRGTP